MRSNDWEYDVYISYNHTDQQWVWNWLIPRLKAEEIRVCTDRETFDIGVARVRNVENAVAVSRHILLVLSPAWIQEGWKYFENTLLQHEDPIGLRQRTLPVLYRPCDPPRHLAMLPYIDLTGEVDTEVEIGKLLNILRGVQRLSDVNFSFSSPRTRRSKDEILTLQEPLVDKEIAALGFRYNPFAFFEAEKMSPEVLEETFVAHPGFDENIMDLNQSAVLLAPRGSGKTAGRRRLETYLNNRQQDTFDHQTSEHIVPYIPLVITYSNFEEIVPILPSADLRSHARSLLAAVAEAIYTFVTTHPNRFMTLSNTMRDWWWAFLSEYLQGMSLNYRVQEDPLATDLLRVTNRPVSFRPDSPLEHILRSLQNICMELGLDHLFILVDGVDGYAETQARSNLEALVAPLLSALPLLSLPQIIWKFFLPDVLEEVVRNSAGCKTGRLNVVSIRWDEPSLISLLHRRFEWASDGQIHDIAQICDQKLLNSVKVELELVRVALQSGTLGAPRALLDRGSQLLRRTKGRLLSLDDWNYFQSHVQQELTSLKELEFDISRLQIAQQQLVNKIGNVSADSDRHHLQDAAELLSMNTQRFKKVGDSTTLLEERRRLIQKINNILYRHFGQTLEDLSS